MAAIDSFDDVRQLAEPALRALLDRGRPEERVWAIWALALRSADHVHDLASRTEPDPGVRRNLAVVLAGHGELDTLVALATCDPAPEVRASAMQLVTRLALDGKLPVQLVVERASSDAAEVRVAVLGTVFPGAPPWLVGLAEQMLADRDADVRYEAFEALVRASQVQPALSWLEELGDAEARLTVMRWSARGRARACAELLAGSSRRIRRLLVESVRVATWDDLAPAIADDPQLVAALARRNRAAFDEIPLAALIRATLASPSDAWIMLIRDRLLRLETPDEVGTLLPAYRDLVGARLAALEREASALRHQDPSTSGPTAEQLDSIEDERVALETALEQATRLLVH